MEISEKVAYLKGLAEGLALDTDTKEGKLIAAIIDVLDDMAEKFVDLEDELCDVEDGLDAVSDDLSDVEEPSTRWMTRTRRTTMTMSPISRPPTPSARKKSFSTRIPWTAVRSCPKCGEKLEFDLSDLANAKDNEDDE